ncbi:MAG TPA: PDZ domain-containing protein [Vicinamibacterales bacterium]|nr:PDZ domain-containing protein [Vicinamibacterales bacterium]
MKKTMIGGVALAAIVALAFVLAPRTEAQQGNRIVPPVAPAPFLPLEGLGSSIGVVVRDQRTSDAAGVVIDSVREGTPAIRAGLQKGDVVLEFDGERARSARQFSRLVRETPPGQAVKMTVMRNGSRRTVDITPEARDSVDIQSFPGVTAGVDRALRAIPRDFNFKFDGEPFGWEGFFGSPGRLGVMVTPMSDQLAAYFGVKDGVLVSAVTENTPAAAAGLKAGDVVMAANGRAVASAADLSREVREVQPGSRLSIRVMRDRKEITVTVTIPEARKVPAGTQPI